MIALPEKWKWVAQPLGPKTRARLEICLGIVLTGAATVGLSTVMRPDPSKLAQMTVAPVMRGVVGERPSEGDLRAEPPAGPKVSPDFTHAVARGDLEAMNKLYTQGMALDGMLYLAAEGGNEPVVRWLLDHEADVHEDESSVDAPSLVADEHPEIVALLFERGAIPPSLATAAEAGAINAVDRLLAAHAPVDPSDASPLANALASTRASAETKQAIVSKLLAAGADPNREYTDTPLAVAVRGCDATRDDHTSVADCLALVKLLVKRGATTKSDALVAALALDEQVRDAPLDALLAARLDRGATAGALANAWNLRPREVKRLIARGVDWAWHDGEEDAALPLLSAVQRDDRDLVRALLDAGAPANVHFKDGLSPLGVAIDGSAGGNNVDYARIVELLVARGADVNRRLPDGRTPLFAAAESGELRVVNALLERGARVNDIVLDLTALDAAEQGGHQPAARVLHAHGGRRLQIPGQYGGQ